MEKWNVLHPNTDVVMDLCTHLRCSPIIATLLANRGVDTPRLADRFLNLSFQQLSDPFLLKDMHQAVSRIHDAIVGQERILIFGDYDVDGVTGTVLLFEFLNATGARVSYYLPHRETEGYGLKPCHISDSAISGNINLIITVDCGSGSHEAVAIARQSGIDVIITDHHTISDPMPEALAVVNPRRNDCPSGAGNLAGVGVVFFLVMALRKYLRERGLWALRKEPNLKKACDLVAMGTIADLVPLTHDNRVLVKKGIDQINSGCRAGIESLIQVGGICRSFLDSEDIAYKLAPRLNAAGRMDHARTAACLLLEQDTQKAQKLAKTLNTLNCQRQSAEKEVLEDIHQRLEQEPEHLQRNALVMAGSDWPSGILGIVASRLVHRFYLPVILISTRNGVGKGSARSIPGFDLCEGLNACASSLLSFGGHAAAAGIELHADMIPAFQDQFKQFADRRICRETLVRAILIDGMLNLRDITPSLISDIESLKPYGAGNPEPVFLARDVRVVSSKILGRNTRRMVLNSSESPSDSGILAVQFNTDTTRPLKPEINEMVYRLRWNYWNGNRTPQILVEDAIFSLQSPMSESIMTNNDELKGLSS